MAAPVIPMRRKFWAANPPASAPRGGQRSNEVVPGEHGGSLVVRNRLRERSLLDREKGPHFLVAGAEHADGGNDEQHDEIGGDHEDTTDQDHETRAGDQHPLSADPIGGSRDPERDDHVSQQGHRQEHADLLLAEPFGLQVQDEYHGEEAVGEHASGAGGK